MLRKSSDIDSREVVVLQSGLSGEQRASDLAAWNGETNMVIVGERPNCQTKRLETITRIYLLWDGQQFTGGLPASFQGRRTRCSSQ